MEIGLMFALLSSACFGVSQVAVRRGVHNAGESLSAALLSVFVGTLLLLALLLFTGEWGKIWSLSWQGFVLLGLAGIIHYVVGRFLNYSSIRIIGANKTVGITRTSIFYAVIFGVIFLQESITLLLVLGVLCIAAGATLASVQREQKTAQMPLKGILYALGCAFCYGISGILVKPAVQEIGSPLAAVSISYVAASILMACFLFRGRQREQLVKFARVSLLPVVIGGIFVATAQFLRYIALSYSPVSVVTPIIGTSGMFVLTFSFFINRKIEVFTWKVIGGIIITVVGTFILFQ
ncbi:DMT family transporter [Chloroflexota bacterium]